MLLGRFVCHWKLVVPMKVLPTSFEDLRPDTKMAPPVKALAMKVKDCKLILIFSPLQDKNIFLLDES